MTKSIIVESLTNVTLDSDEEGVEDEASKEELDTNELDGYVTTERRVRPACQRTHQ